MNRPLIPIGTRVRIDTRSEAYPGALVYIIDFCDDEAYPYCVCPSWDKSNILQAEWVRTEHVKQLRLRE
jgi:hypothetical protein